MALQNYIVIADIKNKLFNRLSDPLKQEYIDLANDELEDLAIRKGVAPADIVTPTHSKLIRYGVQYALSLFSEDRIGFNNTEGQFNLTFVSLILRLTRIQPTTPKMKMNTAKTTEFNRITFMPSEGLNNTLCIASSP